MLRRGQRGRAFEVDLDPMRRECRACHAVGGSGDSCGRVWGGRDRPGRGVGCGAAEDSGDHLVPMAASGGIDADGADGGGSGAGGEIVFGADCRNAAAAGGVFGEFIAVGGV